MSRRLACAALLWIALAAAPALAHHRSGAPHDAGIAIPSLSHGQMRMVAVRRTEILDLADRQTTTDRTFRRLRNFVALQHAACLWMLMPGSIADETSPFNECAHADLAGARALLAHMLDMPNARTAAGVLTARLTQEMHADPAAWTICRFGDEGFSSDAVVFPRLADVPGHLPTLLVLTAAALLPFAGVAMYRHRRHPAAAG